MEQDGVAGLQGQGAEGEVVGLKGEELCDAIGVGGQLARAAVLGGVGEPDFAGVGHIIYVESARKSIF